MTASTNIDGLEVAAQDVEGVAQALHGLASADPGEQIGMALELLARVADGALAAIKAHIDAAYEAGKQAKSAAGTC